MFKTVVRQLPSLAVIRIGESTARLLAKIIQWALRSSIAVRRAA